MAEVSGALGGAEATGGRHRRSVRKHRVDLHFVALYQYLQDGVLHEGERVALLALASGLEIAR
jgi:hypothetical protein